MFEKLKKLKTKQTKSLVIALVLMLSVFSNPAAAFEALSEIPLTEEQIVVETQEVANVAPEVTPEPVAPVATQTPVETPAPQVPVQEEQSQVSSEETVTSSEETVASSEETATSSEETVTSSEETVASSEETATSSEEVVAFEGAPMFTSLFGGEIPMMIESDTGVQTLFLVNFVNIQNNENISLDGVHFYTGDGVKYPESLSSSVSLALDGYTFEGWSTSAGSNELINGDTFVPNLVSVEDATTPQTITLYAVYNKIEDLSTTYTIKYVYEDNTMAFPSYSVDLVNLETLSVDSPVISGAIANLTTINLTGGESNQETIVTYKKDISEFEFKVIFSMQNVDGVGYTDKTFTATAPIGEKISLNDLVKYFSEEQLNTTGFTNISGDKEITISSEEINNEMKFTFDRKVYYITFDTDGGSVIANQKLRYGESVERLTSNPTKTGYNFVKFIDKNSNDVNTVNPIPKTMPAENLEYTAIWESEEVTYSVVYFLEDPDAVPGVQLTEENGLYNTENYNFYKSETFTADAGEEITKLPAGIDNISYATKSWSDVDNNSVIIKGDGTTVINVYFTKNLYTLTFNPTKKSNASSITDCYLVFNGVEYKEELYSINVKYEQDVDAIWPSKTQGGRVYNADGTEYVNFAGWYVRSDSIPVTRHSSITTKLLPTSGTTATITRYDALDTTVDVFYYFEALPEEVAPEDADKIIIKNGITYYYSEFYAQPGLGNIGRNYTPKILVGLKNTLSLYSGAKVSNAYELSQFTYTRNDYKLSYNLQGGEYNNSSSIATKTLMFEQPLQGIKEEYQFMPDASLMQKDGYTFGGWYYEPQLITPVDWENDVMPSDNISVFAKWDAPKITFNADNSNGGYLIDAKGEKSNDESLISTPENRISSPVGYELKNQNPDMIFAGWYVGEEQYLFDKELTDDITVTAKWILNESASYRVIHVLEGDMESTLTYTVDNQKAGNQVLVYPLTSRDLIDEGWAAGYYQADESSMKIDVVGDKEATATFTYKKIETELYPYTVEYLDTNGERIAPNYLNTTNTNSFTTVYGKDITGYRLVDFSNGVVTSASKKYVFKDVSSGNEVVTFYYEKISDPVVYTVNFNSKEDNSISIDSLQINANRWDNIVAGNVTEVINALKEYEEHYTFEGDSSVAKVLGVNTVFNIEITPKDYVATFYNNHNVVDESIFEEISAPYKGEFDFSSEKLADPTRVGYKFIAWGKTADTLIEDAMQATDLQTEVLNNVQYYAVWEQILVTFDVNGGNELPEEFELTKPVNEEGKLEEYPVPSREGFNFIGWYTGNEKTSDKTSLNYVYEEDTTIYALWEEVVEEEVEDETSSEDVTSSEDETVVAPVTEVDTTPDEPENETQPQPTQQPQAGTEDEVSSLIEDVNVEIGESNVPFGGQRRAWALVNLIAALFTALISISLFITYFTNSKKDEEDEETQDEDKKAKLKRKGSLRILSAIIALASLIIFFLTEDMSLAMVYIDSLTPLMLGIAFIQLIVSFFARKKAKEEKEEQKA